jgi:hypothetical protein
VVCCVLAVIYWAGWIIVGSRLEEKGFTFGQTVLGAFVWPYILCRIRRKDGLRFPIDAKTPGRCWSWCVRYWKEFTATVEKKG